MSLLKYKEISFIASFAMFDTKLNIDYLIMSYTVNDNLIVDGLASNNANSTRKTIDYVYDIKEPIGEISFYCQAIFKDGTSSKTLEIESIVVDADGDIINV